MSDKRVALWYLVLMLPTIAVSVMVPLGLFTVAAIPSEAARGDYEPGLDQRAADFISLDGWHTITRDSSTGIRRVREGIT